jgi:CheY-like chemotaxis protein
MMPRLDGFELSAQLRDILGEQMPTVVFVTASTDPDVDRKAADMGYPVVRKPLRQATIDQLLAMVVTGAPSRLRSTA